MPFQNLHTNWKKLKIFFFFAFFFFFFFFFLIKKCLFWVVFNIFSANELKKKFKKKKVGYRCDSNQGPSKLASDALPTELRGLWLQGNS